MSAQHESSQFVIVVNMLLFVVRRNYDATKLLHVTKLHECCDHAACIGNAFMSRPVFNILVRYVAVAELCSSPLSVCGVNKTRILLGSASIQTISMNPV